MPSVWAMRMAVQNIVCVIMSLWISKNFSIIIIIVGWELNYISVYLLSVITSCRHDTDFSPKYCMGYRFLKCAIQIFQKNHMASSSKTNHEKKDVQSTCKYCFQEFKSAAKVKTWANSALKQDTFRTLVIFNMTISHQNRSKEAASDSCDYETIFLTMLWIIILCLSKI